MAAGMQLDLSVLLSEIEALEVQPDRLRIDLGATVIEDADRDSERSQQLFDRIGSTLTGTGAAIARKVLRASGVRRTADIPALRPFAGDVPVELSRFLEGGGSLIVEGTQGAGLSLHHGPFPFTTGRDTTAAAFLSEAGLPPTRVTEVVMVLRTYPIRVGGPSGPLRDEISWEEIQTRSGYPTALAEYTTVTGRLRRVGEFDWDLAKKATHLNGPTALALHGADYLDHSDLGSRSWEDLSSRTKSFVDRLESELAVPVRYIFTGPDGRDLIDRGGGARRDPDRTPEFARLTGPRSS
jgi:adenylosuccinate synthase